MSVPLQESVSDIKGKELAGRRTGRKTVSATTVCRILRDRIQSGLLSASQPSTHLEEIERAVAVTTDKTLATRQDPMLGSYWFLSELKLINLIPCIQKGG